MKSAGLSGQLSIHVNIELDSSVIILLYLFANTLSLGTIQDYKLPLTLCGALHRHLVHLEMLCH